MKPVKISLRIWIAITSLASFLAGWIIFSHAGKPAPLFSSTSSNDTQPTVSTTIDPLPTLAPIPSLNSLVTDPGTVNSGTTTSNNTITSNNTVVQPLPSSPSSNSSTFARPRFRSGGS